VSPEPEEGVPGTELEAIGGHANLGVNVNYVKRCLVLSNSGRNSQKSNNTPSTRFVGGLLLQLPTLTWVGIILFGSSSLFALLTLPVEFNASARAQKLLVSQGIIRGDEQIAGVQKVLGAAAWTYVAAAVSAIGVWLFYLFVLFFRGRSASARL
jgi:Zn-dependent membrane protease YugP